MKIKKLVLLTLTLIACLNKNISTANNYLNNYNNIKYENFLNNDEYKKQQFNDSLETYIKKEYNSLDYAEYISQNGTHFIELLKVVDSLQLKNEAIIYFYTVFKLFNDKIKAIDLIDHSVLHQILEEFPAILHPYFKSQGKNFSTNLSRLVDIAIKSKLESPIKAVKPQSSVKSFKSDILNIFSSAHNNEKDFIENSFKLRGIIVRFLENALGKTIWSKSHYETNWNSFIILAAFINKLFELNIIDDEDDIDSLKWSLTHAFCRFTDILGHHLPLGFYENIEDDLAAKIIPFLEEEEQDAFITSKKITLARALFKGKNKAKALKDAGIFS